MIVDVKVPMLAESVADATLMSWHKKPGDTVKRGDSLIDIETDKVTLEVAAPNNGVISEILKQDGEDVSSDEVIARIDTKASKASDIPVITGLEETTADEAVTPVQESIPEQQSLPVLDEAQFVEETNNTQQDIPEVTEEETENDEQTKLEPPKLSPAVRNLIEKHDLNVDKISHDENDNRITKADVLQHLENPEMAASTKSNPEPAADVTDDSANEPAETVPPESEAELIEESPQPLFQEVEKEIPQVSEQEAPVTEPDRRETREPMTRLRQRIAERLLAAQQENAILTTFNEVNMQPVMDLRARYKDEFEQKHGVKLGFMSFFCKAAVEALKSFPILNASVETNDIIYHEYYDLGIAVSSPRGLVVPVLRDVDNMTLSDIETSIRDYGDKAKQGQLDLEDLIGGTFTITNGGVFGSLLSTPIINPPQSGILGMHKIQERPVAENGNVVIRPMMYLALSYDHRIIDGRDAVQFLVTVKEQLEDPARLLLQI